MQIEVTEDSKISHKAYDIYFHLFLTPIYYYYRYYFILFAVEMANRGRCSCCGDGARLPETIIGWIL